MRRESINYSLLLAIPFSRKRYIISINVSETTIHNSADNQLHNELYTAQLIVYIKRVRDREKKSVGVIKN